MFRYNYTSNYTCYHYQHSYLNSEAEGFATLRDNQGIVIAIELNRKEEKTYISLFDQTRYFALGST